MKKYRFWDPIKGAWANKRYIFYFGISLGILQSLLHMEAINHNLLLLFLIFLSVFFISILYSGFKIKYINESIKNKKYCEIKTTTTKELFIKGLIAFTINIIFSAGVSLLMGILFMACLLIGILLFHTISSNIIKISYIIIASIITLAPLLIYSYISPLIYAFYAKKYEFEDAFKIKEILKRAFTKEYTKVILKAVGLLVILSLILTPLFLLHLSYSSIMNSAPSTHILFLSLQKIFFSINKRVLLIVDYLIIILIQIVAVFISLSLAYYAYEGYIRTNSIYKNKRG